MKKNISVDYKIQKLLREYVSTTIILERKTDELYVKICDWVVDKIFQEKNYLIHINLNDENKTYNTTEQKKPILTLQRFFANSQLDEVYKEYISATGDNEILNTKEKFKTAFDRFRIECYNFNAGFKFGDMSNLGEMRLFANFEELNNEEALKGQLSVLHKLPDVVKMHFKKNKNHFVHEFSHYLNAVRSNYKSYRSKGGIAQYDMSKKEYLDSTEELQAYLIQAYSIIKDSIKAGEPDVSGLTTALARDDFGMFLKEFLRVTFQKIGWFDANVDANDERPGGFGDESGLITTQGKRIIKRVYEMFEQLKETVETDAKGLNKVAYKSGSLDRKIAELGHTLADKLHNSGDKSLANILSYIFKIGGLATSFNQNKDSDLRTGVRGL